MFGVRTVRFSGVFEYQEPPKGKVFLPGRRESGEVEWSRRTLRQVQGQKPGGLLARVLQLERRAREKPGAGQVPGLGDARPGCRGGVNPGDLTVPQPQGPNPGSLT